MTCEEWRTATRTTDPANVTRGERAAIIAHGINCPTCSAFITDPGPLDDDLVPICRADMADREFMDIVLRK